MNQRAQMRRVPPAVSRVYRTLLVDAGQARWGLDLRPRFEPPGDPTLAEVLDAQGNVLTQVQAYHETVADGEQAYFVPAPHAGWHAVRVPGSPAMPYSVRTQNEPFRR